MNVTQTFSLAALRLATRPRVLALTTRLLRASAVSQGSSASGAFALTFDDGPHPVWTPRVLDALDLGGAKATFFVVGKFAKEHPEIVKDAHARGHEIATHLFTHERVVDDDRAFARELEESVGLLESITGDRVKWLRFPWGDRGAQTPRRVTREHGLGVAYWTFSAHDGFLPTAAVVARVRAGLRAGAIVLMHDRLADDGPDLPPPYEGSRQATCEAIPEVLRAGGRAGLRGVTLTRLFR